MTTTTLADRATEVLRRIDTACDRAGRDPSTVTLIAVSKTHPAATVAEAMTSGLTAFGENRAQELVPKAEAAQTMGLQPQWHFIGHLQRNKVRDVLPHVAVLHSLDSERLVDEIVARWDERGSDEPLPCFIEVNVAGEAQKEGVDPDRVPALLAAARASGVLDVRGLMTVAPHADDGEAVRPIFVRLRELAAQHGLRELSMGMTDDFEVAIEEGATAVRVGRAIFGERLA